MYISVKKLKEINPQVAIPCLPYMYGAKEQTMITNGKEYDVTGISGNCVRVINDKGKAHMLDVNKTCRILTNEGQWI